MPKNEEAKLRFESLEWLHTPHLGFLCKLASSFTDRRCRLRRWALPNRHCCFTKNKHDAVVYQTRYQKKLDLVRDSGCHVAPSRVNIYYPLQKILKYITQNLSHGSIF